MQKRRRMTAIGLWPVTETTVPSQKEKGQKGRTGDIVTKRLKL